jgi:hypothetical protein
MKYLLVLSAVYVSMMISGCGTFLAISELDVKKELKNPDGLVINRRGEYTVKVGLNTLKEIEGKDKEVITNQLEMRNRSITGVDHDKVIKLDVNRMPFSDGKLNVKLNDFQLMKEVELTSKTGADKAATAAQTGIDTHTKIKTLLKPVPKNDSNDKSKK